MSMNTSIVAAGQKVDIGSRVVLWDEPDGLSFYKYGVKYGKRDGKTAEKEIDSFIFHHSVTYTAKQTYNALIGRNLSVNFIIADDNIEGAATIYQCLDIKDFGQSQGEFNRRGPGVEISYLPEAWSRPNAYSEHNRKRFGCEPHDVVQDIVHGTTLKVYAPSAAQIEAVINLTVGICQLYPAVDSHFPKGPDGKAARTIVKNPKGLLAHSMITRNKIDPSGFPFEYVEQTVTQRLIYGE